MNKLELFAENHIALTRRSLQSFLVISFVLWIGSWSFGSLLIEEMVSACTNHNTLLQTLGLNLNGINKYCSNTEKHTYLTNSLVEIGVCFAYGYMMINGITFSKKWLDSHKRQNLRDDKQ